MKPTDKPKEETDKPVEIKKDTIILQSKQGVFNIKITPTQFKQPILILIMNGNYIKIIENAKAGEFIIKDVDGSEKSIMLSPQKLLDLQNGEQHIKCWIGYEDDMETYPNTPIFSAKMFRAIVQRLTMNYSNANTNKSNIPWGMIIGIGIVLGLGFLAYKSGMLNGLLHIGKAAATTANQTINQTIQNMSNLPTGIQVK